MANIESLSTEQLVDEIVRRQNPPSTHRMYAPHPTVGANIFHAHNAIHWTCRLYLRPDLKAAAPHKEHDFIECSIKGAGQATFIVFRHCFGGSSSWTHGGSMAMAEFNLSSPEARNILLGLVPAFSWTIKGEQYELWFPQY